MFRFLFKSKSLGFFKAPVGVFLFLLISMMLLIFQDDHYIGPPVDIWALGILLYFLVTGTMPFKAGTVSSLKHAILEGVFITPSHVSPACSQLISSILKRKPGSRFTMTQIASSQWLEGLAWPQAEAGYKPFPR